MGLRARLFGGKILAVGTDILKALDASSKPMNVSELEQATGRNGALIVNVVGGLRRAGHVSASNTGKARAATDITRYAITSAGKKWLKDHS